MKDNLCLVTGGFDPIHQGHIEYIKSAKKISSYLVIGLNSDDWLLRKKNYVFMPWKQRAEVLKSISYVDEVISFDDSDDSAYDAINICLKKSPKVIFIIILQKYLILKRAKLVLMTSQVHGDSII